MRSASPLRRGLLAAVSIPTILAALATAQPSSTGPLAPPPNGPRRADPTWVALVNATVTTKPGETLRNAAVIFRDGVITAVLPAEPGPDGKPGTEDDVAPRLPMGPRIVDCNDLFIYPAFIDPYVEVDAPRPGAEAAGRHWNDFVTPQRTALDGAGIDSRTADSLRKLGFAAAAISPSGGIFRGSSAVVSLARPVSEESAAKPPVYGTLAYQTVAFDTSGRGYPGSLMGAIALVRQTLSDAQWQADNRAGGAITGPFDAVDFLAPEQKYKENDRGPARATMLLMTAGDELDTLRCFKIADEFNRPFMMLGSGYEFRRLAAIAERKDVLHIIPLAFPKAPDVSSPGKAESTELRELMTWEQAPTNPRRLAQAGITFALTTAKLRDRNEFRKNLLSAIKHGLTEDQALAALTTTPADIAGVAGTVGTIERGKRANLIVSDGPIFAEKSKIRAVWADGHEHEISRGDNRIEGEWTFPMGHGDAAVEATLVISKDAISIKLPKPPEEKAADEKAPDEKAEGAEPAADKPAEPPAGDDAARPAPEGDAAAADAQPAEEKKADKPAIVTIKAKKQRIEDNRATFVIDGADFPKAYRTPEHDGVMAVSLTLIGDTIRGQVQFPAGDRADFVAARKPAEEADAAKDDAKKGDASKDGEKKDEQKKDDESDAIASIPETYGYPFGPYALSEQPAQPDFLELRGATLWTNTDQGRIDNATIIIRKGKIDYVGKPFTGKRPEGAIEIDLPPGTHITPGIIDAHSHTGIARGVNEGGQAITSEVRIQDVLDPDDISWYRQLAGGVTAVLQLHGSANAIGGQSQTTKVRWGVENPEDMHMEGAIAGIKFALGENPRGANWSSERGRYPQSRMGVETLIRDRFTAAKEYAAATGAKPANGEATQRRDLELEAIAEILAGERLIHCHSYRQDEIVMLCLVARDFGFKIGTFQHILEGYKVADYVRDYSGGGSAFSDWWAFKVEVQDAIPGGPPLMHEVGAVVSYNSDSDELARRLNVEAAKAVKYGGISPEEAFKFVTLNPAKQLKIDDRTGSLEPGKDADIAVWNGNPLSGMTKCIATYVDGRRLFSIQDDAAHRETIAAERTRLIQKILTEGKKRKTEDEGREPREPRTPVAEEQPPGDDSVSEEYRRMREQLYLDMLNRGMSPDAARPGECGCGILHW